MSHYQVIDPNYRRRAQVARELASFGLHAEIYQDLNEFFDVAPDHGIVLAMDGTHRLDERLFQNGLLGLPVVLYSENPVVSRVVDTVKRSALDYLAWPFDDRALARLIGHSRDGGGARAVELQQRAQATSLVKRLSSREREVLALLVDGGSNKSIGKELGISSRTVEIHRANTMDKLGAANIAQAVKIALVAGLDDEESVDRRHAAGNEQLAA